MATNGNAQKVCVGSAKEKICDICGLEEAVMMAAWDGEYCFLY